MKRKLYGIALTIGVLASILVADTIQNDMTKGYDFTSASSVTASKLNQLVDQAIPAANRGMIIYTNSAPTAADLVNAPRLSRFIWLKSTDNPPTVFTYNASSTNWESAGIADGSITLAKLATDSVNSDKIVNASVTGTDIAASTVANANLADNSVTSSKIQDGSITSADLLTNTISLNYLTTDSVNSSKIVDASIVAADIASRTITSDLISIGGINVTNMAANAITSTNITDAAVTLAKIDDSDFSAFQIMRADSAGNTMEAVNPGILQFVYHTSATEVSVANTYSDDDSTVNTGECDLVLSKSFTPKTASSVLVVEFTCHITASSAVEVAACLFDGGAAAISVVEGVIVADSDGLVLTLKHIYTGHSTSAITFSGYVGKGGAVTVLVNANTSTSGHNFGDTLMPATLTITEILN